MGRITPSTTTQIGGTRASVDVARFNYRRGGDGDGSAFLHESAILTVETGRSGGGTSGRDSVAEAGAIIQTTTTAADGTRASGTATK